MSQPSPSHIRATAVRVATLRRLALSVLFTIATTSYQTTCTVSERTFNKRQHANARYRVESHSRITHYDNNNKLQTNIQFSNKDTLNILLNNSRSFKKHFNAIQHNKLILQQHINIFLESKLCKHDKSIDYTIDDYMIVRADQKNNILQLMELFHT